MSRFELRLIQVIFNLLGFDRLHTLMKLVILYATTYQKDSFQDLTVDIRLISQVYARSTRFL